MKKNTHAPVDAVLAKELADMEAFEAAKKAADIKAKRDAAESQRQLAAAAARRLRRAQRPQGIAARTETPKTEPLMGRFLQRYEWHNEPKLGPRLTPLKPFAHQSRKVGRNEPCPCGSEMNGVPIKNKACCNMVRAPLPPKPPVESDEPQPTV